jgi:hypothetical protein
MLNLIEQIKNRMEKFILNCSLGNETCELTFSMKKRSVFNAYDVYKNGQWICLIHRQSKISYQMISYLYPLLQSDIDTIGKQLELRADNNIITAHSMQNKRSQSVYR